ncbi:hypothetical protein D6827_02265 [Candidatus Parcubacteria bacterium]|nr:MAG: hypothetical protein D6827_02265 [Candidatus Parcubacteria bacterium]
MSGKAVIVITLVVFALFVLFLYSFSSKYNDDESLPYSSFENNNQEFKQNTDRVEYGNNGNGQNFANSSELEVDVVNNAANDKIDNNDANIANVELQIPTKLNLAVPFTSQAPLADWGEPYQEACEETAAYMAALYFADYSEAMIDAQKADKDIKSIIAFEEKKFGFYEDTTAEQTADLIEKYFNLPTRVLTNPTIDDIKTELASGRPVLVPTAGRLLNNPYFSGDGPLYHMLVIRGYDNDTYEFIVNDPGTKRGANYRYKMNVIMEAMGDWNDGDPAQGAKKIILINVER